MDSLVQTIYASEGCSDFHEYDIPDLLTQIRPANAKARVTGILLYVGQSFLQLLEGPAASVDAIFARIVSDSRHTKVSRLTREPVSERQFPDWTMDFVAIHPVDAGVLIGRADSCENDFCMNLDAGGAKALIAALKRPSWQKSRIAKTPALSRAVRR